MTQYYGAIGAGDIDIVGAGDLDIVGDEDLMSALSGDELTGNQAQVAAQMAQLRMIDPQAKVMRRASSFIRRRLTIGGTTSVDVPAGGTFALTVQPQRPFKTTRFVVSSDIAFYFDITDVKVGQVSQLAASSVTPASAFTEQALGSAVDWDTADIGNLIVITGTNVHSLPHPFRSALFGVAMLPQF